MKRRINYTGRQRITRDRIKILLERRNGVVNSFSATLNLENMTLDKDAKVYLMAYHGLDRRRFDYGTVEVIIPPGNRNLSDFPSGDSLHFRLLVVAERSGHGLILAHADGVAPTGEASRKSILPTEFRDLGQKVWDVAFTGYGGAPVLRLNATIPSIESIAISDPSFFFHVYPAVLREVLRYMVFVEGVDIPEDPSVQWHSDWLRFANEVTGFDLKTKVMDPKHVDFDRDDTLEWIESIVEEFCSSRKNWTQFITTTSKSE